MQWIGSSKFPTSSKFANVTLVFKQGSRNLKENERPVSILPIISKTFGKLICGQLSNHFNNILAKFRSSHRRCSVRKSVFRNFTKFTGKHLCQSIFLIKLQASFYRKPSDDCFWKHTFSQNKTKPLRLNNYSYVIF